MYHNADQSSSWSGLTYVEPSAPISPTAKVFQGITFDEGGHWQRHYGPYDPAPRNLSNYAVLTASQVAKLHRVVHETILLFCGSRGQVSGHTLHSVYERFLAWKKELPRLIADGDNDQDALPHVLSMQ